MFFRMSAKSKKYKFKYETHLHTSEGSACARSTGAEMTATYIEAGYSGIIVTDHFFNGNCAVPASLPWRERVNLFCKGYENALSAVGKHEFTVFFGWEYNYCGTEFLTYGLDERFLLNHEDMLDWDVKTYLTKARHAGGFISHAHPFRQRSYIAEIRLFPEHVDAVEIYNAGNPPEYNLPAVQYADEHGLFATAGTDKHMAPALNASGMAFDHKLESIEDFISAVRSRDFKIINQADS